MLGVSPTSIEDIAGIKEKYKSSLEEKFPNIKFIVGTHEEHITTDEFKKRVKDVFNQQRKTMVDIIFNK